MTKKVPMIYLCMLALAAGLFLFNGCGGDQAPDSAAMSTENTSEEEKGTSEDAGPNIALQDESFDLELPLDKGVRTVQAQIPQGWMRNTDFGSIVFQPPDKDDFFYPPMIQYTTSCGGPCDAATIPANIEKAIQGIKDTLARPNINTGDAELDAVRADVEVLLDEKFEEDGWILAAAVTYAEELSSAQYIAKVVIHAFRHHPGDEFFIQTTAHAALDQKDALLSVLTAACRATNY